MSAVKEGFGYGLPHTPKCDGGKRRSVVAVSVADQEIIMWQSVLMAASSSERVKTAQPYHWWTETAGLRNGIFSGTRGKIP